MIRHRRCILSSIFKYDTYEHNITLEVPLLISIIYQNKSINVKFVNKGIKVTSINRTLNKKDE